MKKLLMVLAFASLIGPGVVAAHDSYGSRLDAMAEHFDLSDAQKERVKKIFKEQHAKQRALREETHRRLAEVLTPEQLDEMEHMRHYGPDWNWYGGYGPGPGPGWYWQ